MPVPSSGQLRLRADIALEVDGSATGDNVSLGTLSNTAGFTEPDAMSEFYGYTSCTVPSVTTNTNTSVTTSSLVARGDVTNDNGCTVTSRGFYFGTSSTYSNNSKYSVGSGTGAFTRTFTGLTSGTTYYSTAYAINSEGEARGTTRSTTIPYPSLGLSVNFQYGNVASYSTHATQSQALADCYDATADGWSGTQRCTANWQTQGSSSTPTTQITIYAYMDWSGGGAFSSQPSLPSNMQNNTGYHSVTQNGANIAATINNCSTANRMRSRYSKTGYATATYDIGWFNLD
jgi:hypothetical protein